MRRGLSHAAFGAALAGALATPAASQNATKPSGAQAVTDVTAPQFAGFKRGFILVEPGAGGKQNLGILQITEQDKRKHMMDDEVLAFGRTLCKERSQPHKRVNLSHIVDPKGRMIMTFIKCR